MKTKTKAAAQRAGRSRRTGCVAVTGGSGKTGRFVVRELVEHGFDVLNLDWAPPPADLPGRFTKTDLTNFGEAVDALSGCDAIVHLAAIPAPGRRPAAATFCENTVSTFNVFEAARLHRVRRVVWASSETLLGLPFDNPLPAYAPIDEAHPDLPQSTYSLSKAAGETMARHYARWTGVPFVGLRFSNVMHPDDYRRFPGWQEDARVRKWNLWGYIDGRDAAQSCRLALGAKLSGAENFIIAAADTVMLRPSAQLMAEVFPRVPLRRKIKGRETLLAIDKARRVLGFDPKHTWREHLSP